MSAPVVPQRCTLYAGHRPAALRLVTHHIQPLAMQGADDASNWIAGICDNCHYGIHRILGALILGHPLPAGFRPLREVAMAGYNDWVAAGEPGRPVFETEALVHGTAGYVHAD